MRSDGKSAVVSSSTGVNVVYTIKADATITLTTVTTKLETAVTAGTFTKALVSAGFTSASGKDTFQRRRRIAHHSVNKSTNIPQKPSSPYLSF